MTLIFFIHFFALFACFYLCVLCEEQKIPRKGRKGCSRKARKDVISSASEESLSQNRSFTPLRFVQDDIGLSARRSGIIVVTGSWFMVYVFRS